MITRLKVETKLKNKNVIFVDVTVTSKNWIGNKKEERFVAFKEIEDFGSWKFSFNGYRLDVSIDSKYRYISYVLDGFILSNLDLLETEYFKHQIK